MSDKESGYVDKCGAGDDVGVDDGTSSWDDYDYDAVVETFLASLGSNVMDPRQDTGVKDLLRWTDAS